MEKEEKGETKEEEAAHSYVRSSHAIKEGDEPAGGIK